MPDAVLFGSSAVTGEAGDRRVLVNANGEVLVNLAVADIEIGAVELKDGASDARAAINAANTARTTATVVQAVQVIGADGAVLPAVPVLAAGEAHIGSVGGNTVVVSATPTLTVHATYAANDYVGTSATPITFANCARVAAGSGEIRSAILVDYALQSLPLELWLFDTAVTPPADSAAWTISDADAAHCVAVIPFNTYYASALNSISSAPSIGQAFVCAAADRNLYGCLVTRGAPAYASGDLTIKLKLAQD